MIKKEIVEGINLREVKVTFLELEDTIRAALSEATSVKQIFSTFMDSKGVSIHSVNVISIEKAELDYFNGNLVLSIDDYKFSLAINVNCNIVIKENKDGAKCNLLFPDIQMNIQLL